MELLEIMKRHWLVCADPIEWSGSRGTLVSGSTGSLLTVNSLSLSASSVVIRDKKRKWQ